MVSIRGLPSADQAGMLGDKPDVIAVAYGDWNASCLLIGFTPGKQTEPTIGDGF
jgi:hypothetical protein